MGKAQISWYLASGLNPNFLSVKQNKPPVMDGVTASKLSNETKTISNEDLY